MIKLTWWEKFIIGAAITFLNALLPGLNNAAQIAALKAAIAFLSELEGGKIAGARPPAEA